jgi:hypothetical protein
MAYVTSSSIAAFLGVPDTDDDVALDLAANAACAEVDEFCGWSFDQGGAAATARTYEATDYLTVYLHDGGFWDTASLVVKTDDDADGVFETTWTADTDYFLEPANGRWRGVAGVPYFEIRATGSKGFPCSEYGRRLVQVTAKWGWQTLPAPVEQVATLRAAQLGTRRDSRLMINPESGFRAGGWDRDWELLLDRYRHPSKLVPLA